MTDVRTFARDRRSFVLAIATGAVFIGASRVWSIFRPSPQELFHRAMKLARSDPKTAEQLFHQAVSSAGGSYPDAQLALCRLLIQRKAKEEASSLFAVIDCSACRTDLLLDFGRNALRQNQWPEGFAALECLGRRGGREGIEALESLLEHCSEWGQREKQTETAALLTRIDPDCPKRWADLLDLQTALGMETEAIRTIQQALRHDFPVEFRRYLQNTLVQQLVNRGDATTARQELTELQKLEGDSARVMGMKVYVCRLEGDLPNALRIVDGIINDAPSLPFPRFTRGIILIDMRELGRAAEDLSTVIAAQPFNAPAHFKLSEAYRGLGREDLSERHRQSANDIVTRQRRVSELLKEREARAFDPHVYLELERLHRELGDPDTARLWQRWAVRVAKLSRSP